MRSLQLVFIILALISCSSESKSKRMPSSLTSYESVNSLLSSLQDDVFLPVQSSVVCGDTLESYYYDFFTIKSDNNSFSTLTDEQIESLVSKSFNIRTEIYKKLKMLQINTGSDYKCLQRVRDIVRVLRYTEDYLSEISFNRIKSDEKLVGLTGNGLHFMVADNYKGKFSSYKDLKSGDVILSRGNAYSSAAIARIGTTDAQFSHLSLVYKDEKNELHTIEAHIEIGNVVAPFQTHLDFENAREVVFRYHDQKLAHEAAKYMYEKVKARQEKKKNIPYDFAMNYKDNSEIFCSEVIYDGFHHVSKGELDIPRFKSQFHAGAIPFLNKIGIKVTAENIEEFETFSPGDIEFDGRFELVAEWKNPAKMGDSRIKDMVLTKIFEWMENEGYEFKPRFGIKFQAGFAWLLRRVPLAKRMLIEKFPTNMGTDSLRLFVVLDEVGQAMYDYVVALQETKSELLTPIEMYDALETFRKADLILYLANRGKPQIHKQFKPSKTSLKDYKVRFASEIEEIKRKIKKPKTKGGPRKGPHFRR